MATLKEQLQRANKLTPEKVNQELFDFIRSIESELTALNKKQLNEESKDIYGDAIGFYSYATEVITKGAKKKGEPFDVKDTGKLLGGLYAKIQNNMIVFGSTDPKVDLIMDSDNWLSKDLFGLSDENLNMVIEQKLKPFVLQLYRNTLEI